MSYQQGGGTITLRCPVGKPCSQDMHRSSQGFRGAYSIYYALLSYTYVICHSRLKSHHTDITDELPVQFTHRIIIVMAQNEKPYHGLAISENRCLLCARSRNAERASSARGTPFHQLPYREIPQLLLDPRLPLTKKGG